jgi:hypothetical protein
MRHMKKGFSVLYGGLGISKLQFFIKKNIIFFQLTIFSQFLVLKALDSGPDLYSAKNAEMLKSGS